MKIEINKSQRWLILWMLVDLTSIAGQEKFLKEFPHCDLDAMRKDLEDLSNKLREGAE